MQSPISADKLEQVRLEFLVSGKVVKDWARENQYPAHLVYAVLSGRAKARRGLSHGIAVKLGLIGPEKTADVADLEKEANKT